MPGYSPLDYNSAMNLGRVAVPDLQGMIDAGQDRSIKQANTSLQREQFDAKQGRLLQYQTELAELQRVPPAQRAQAIAAFMQKWPEYADQLKNSYDLSDKSTRDVETTRLGQIAELMKGGHYDLAIKKLEERRAADAAAGQPEDTISNNIIDALKTGDRNKIAEAETAVGTMMYGALGGDKYVERVAGGSTKSAFKEKLDLITAEGGDDLRKDFIATTAQGPLQPIYQDGQIYSGRIGDFPRYPTANPTPPKTTENAFTKVGLPADTRPGRDEKRGLTVATSSQFAKPMPVVFSAADLAKVESGENYISTKDDKVHVKP